MSSRRREEEEHENHERWLVSYADFITLLFAFFVVMYAVSSVNEGKYRVLSDSIVSAFRALPGNSAGAMVAVNPMAASPVTIPIKRNLPSVKEDQVQSAKKEKLRSIARELNKALAPLVEQGKVKVTEGAFGITVDINASVLFGSGDARLNPVAERALVAVAQVLGPTEFPVAVEGHTDNLTGAVFSPDGQFILTWSDDKTARLWDKNGMSVKTFFGHTAYVSDAVFSPDGQFILTASGGKTIRLWDAFSGYFQHHWSLHRKDFLQAGVREEDLPAWVK